MILFVSAFVSLKDFVSKYFKWKLLDPAGL